MGIFHSKVITAPSTGDSSLAQGPDWNDPHVDTSVVDVGVTAVGDGVADDQAAIQAAVNSAIATNSALHFPPGTYRVSKFVDFLGARNMRITGSGATIVYPSDDPSVHASGGATSDNQARSAFLMRYCSRARIEGLTFQGGTSPSFDLVNVGVGVYETHCQGTQMIGCTGLDGNALHQQDAQPDTAATGDSISVSSGVVTLTSSAGLFLSAHVGHQVTIASATDRRNNGVFVITAASSTQVRYLNPAAQAETSGLSWSIDDGDRGTLIDGCTSRRCRSTMTVGSHSKIVNSRFEQPLTIDITGIPSKFVAGSPTVMSSVKGAWDAAAVGKYMLVQGSTSAANDGLFLITAATPPARFAPGTLSYTNGGAVTEAASATSTFCIFGGEKTGKGNGATALAVSAGTVTLTSGANAFSVADIGKIVRVARATTAANNGAYVITGSPAANQVTFTNSGGVSETFAGAWSVDGHDAAGPAGAAFGSTHAIYLFAGRHDVEVANCTFVGIRKNCLKGSGTSTPLRNVHIHHCHAFECGAMFTAGADDANEHADFRCDNNVLIDCGTGRPGWGESVGITFLGCKGASASYNQFYYTRPAVSACDGRATVAGLFAIQATRYVVGKTQPLEDVTIRGNKATADRVNTTPGIVTSLMINASYIGIDAFWGGPPATLTFATPLVTLLDSTAAWSQDLVGSPIQIVGATSAGNNGTFTILSVNGTSSLTFSNAAGVAEALPTYGAYRIKRLTGRRGGICRITDNECDGAAQTVVSTTSCVGPDLTGGIANNCNLVEDIGSVSPLIAHLRLAASTGVSTAHVKISSTTTWPTIHDNTITAHALGGGALGLPELPAVARGDVGIGVDSFSPVDYPLRGKLGRVTQNGGRTENVIGFGSLLVEGEAFLLNGSTWTYTANPAPGAGKFNTFADDTGTNVSLKTRATGSGFTAEDYGARFSTPVVTGHLAIRTTASTNSVDLGSVFSINVLNPTALVVLRNRSGGGESGQYSQGEAVAGAAVHVPIWSQLADFGGVVLTADKSPTGTADTGAAWLAGGYYVDPPTGGAINNLGCCNVARTVNTPTGNEELRWFLP